MTEAQVPWAMVTHLGYALKLDEEQSEKIGRVVAQWSKNMFTCAEIFDECESPIERLFLLAPFLQGCDANGARIERVFLVVPLNDGDGEIWIRPQYKVSDWSVADAQIVARVDFELTLRADSVWSTILIECDGHEFHDKTKEQAAADKARDRRVVALGHRIMRFTGSEIYASPQKCFNEVVSALRFLAEEKRDSDDQLESRARHVGFAEGYTRRGESLAVLADNVLDASKEDAAALLRRHGFLFDREGKMIQACLHADSAPEIATALQLRRERHEAGLIIVGSAVSDEGIPREL